jgi:hypothetical protein
MGRDGGGRWAGEREGDYVFGKAVGVIAGGGVLGGESSPRINLRNRKI